MKLSMKEQKRAEKRAQHDVQELLVRLYKDSGDSAGLIEQYEPFLSSYFSLFKRGDLNLKNRSLRIFVSKFIGASDVEKGKYANSFKYADNREEYGTYAATIVGRMASLLEEDELRQDLIITLLTLAKRYEFMGRNFTAYLSVAFPHEFYRQIRHLHLHVTMNTKSYHDPDNGDVEMPTTSIESDSKLILNLDGDFELMHPEWLSGETASEPFKSMTRRERYIIAKYYEAKFFNQRISDRIIGQTLGRNVKSINRTRGRVLERLEPIWERGEAKWLGVRKVE